MENGANVHGLVSVVELMDGMLADVNVCVKLLSTAYELSQPVSNFKSAGILDLYEALIGDGGMEYTVVGKGNAAWKALQVLAPFPY